MPRNLGPKRGRRTVTAMTAGLVAATFAGQPATAAPSGAPESTTASTDTPAAQPAENPLEALYLSDRAQAEGQHPDRAAIYQAMLQKDPPDSFWGQWAALNTARQRLAGGGTADPAGARDALGRLPPALKHPALADQRRLWQAVLVIHQTADRVLADPSSHPDWGELADPTLPPVPERLRSDAQWAVHRVGQRFEDQPARGAACFEAAVQQIPQPTLQAAALRSLSTLALAADDKPTAAAAARAYWLTSVAEPGRLPRAIDTVTAVMRAEGAGKATRRAFRRQQMGGSEDQRAPVSVLQPASPGSPPGSAPENASKKALFPSSQIQALDSPLDRARLHLLNGQLSPAAVILQKQLATDLPRAKRRRALTLVRMAFALHDGDMHRIGRYERYLAQPSGDANPNPLRALVQDPAAPQARAIASD